MSAFRRFSFSWANRRPQAESRSGQLFIVWQQTVPAALSVAQNVASSLCRERPWASSCRLERYHEQFQRRLGRPFTGAHPQGHGARPLLYRLALDIRSDMPVERRDGRDRSEASYSSLSSSRAAIESAAWWWTPAWPWARAYLSGQIPFRVPQSAAACVHRRATLVELS